MNSNSAEQLRALHPDASVEALEFHAHIIEYAMKGDAPTEILIDFAHVVPKAPLPIVGVLKDVHGHAAELWIYGLYQGECTRCVSSYPLWTPRPQDDLLAKPELAESVLFDMGLILDRMVKLERRYPNARFKDVIAHHEDTIDRFDDLITESEAYRNPPREIEDGGRSGY
jgi:hypothetical protein